jgi:hypothetical protein
MLCNNVILSHSWRLLTGSRFLAAFQAVAQNRNVTLLHSGCLAVPGELIRCQFQPNVTLYIALKTAGWNNCATTGASGLNLKMFPRVARICVFGGTAEEDDAVSNAVKRHGMKGAWRGARVLNLSPVLSIKAPAIPEGWAGRKMVSENLERWAGRTLERLPAKQDNYAAHGCHRREKTRGRTELRDLSPGCAIPSPGLRQPVVHQDYRVNQTNPATSLVRMNSNEGIFFNTYIDIVVIVEMRGQPSEVRQTIYVRVNATNNEIVQLA